MDAVAKLREELAVLEDHEVGIPPSGDQRISPKGEDPVVETYDISLLTVEKVERIREGVVQLGSTLERMRENFDAFADVCTTVVTALEGELGEAMGTLLPPALKGAPPVPKELLTRHISLEEESSEVPDEG